MNNDWKKEIMGNARSGLLKFVPRLSPFMIASLLVFVIVTLLVFANEERRFQRQQSQPPSYAAQWIVPTKATSTEPSAKELLLRKQPDLLVRNMVPLASPNKQFLLYQPAQTSRVVSSTDRLRHASVLRQWRAFFKERNLPLAEVSHLNAVQHVADTILIVPSVVALSSAERHDLESFQQRGGSILATWALGSRDEMGVFQGYGFLQRLFGIEVTGDIGKDNPEQYLNLVGNTPVTGGFSAGQRIWIDNSSEKSLRLTGGTSAGMYSGWDRNVHSGAPTAGLAYGEHDARLHHARWVILGFSEKTWDPQTDMVAGLLENSLHWLARGVTLSHAPWPVPYRAASVFEMDTEEGFPNAASFARMMDDNGIAGTFYCITHEALSSAQLVRDLSKRHEIALHGDVHTSVRGLSAQVLSDRFDLMQRDMKTLLGQPLRRPGFRSPMEKYDNATENMLETKGFGHHAADPNRTDATLPFFYRAGEGANADSLVIIPRTQRDDFNLPITGNGPEAATSLLSALEADFEMAVQLRGLGFLSIHSQNFNPAGLLPTVMPDFLRHVASKQEQVWITSASQIAQWWHERGRLAYTTQGTSSKFALAATIAGETPLARGALIITHPQADLVPQIRPRLPGGPVPKIKELDALQSTIVFDGMAPGSYAFEVTFRPAIPLRVAL